MTIPLLHIPCPVRTVRQTGITILLLLVLFSSSCLARTHAANFSQEELDYLQTHPTLSVQIAEDWPPFNFTDNNRLPVGYVNDFMDLLARKIGVSLEFIHGHHWEKYMEMLATGEIDCISNMTVTEKRKTQYGFSKEVIIDVFNGLLTEKEGPVLTDLEPLRGKTVAVVRGYSQEELLKQYYPDIKLLRTENLLDSIRQVMAKNADAAIGAHPVFNYYISKFLLEDVRSSPITSNTLFPSAPHHIAVHRDNKLLLSIIDKGVAAISEGERKRLKNKWFIAASGSTNQVKLNHVEKAYLSMKGEIRFCADPDWHPVETIDGNRHGGMISDYMQLLRERIGTPLTLVPTTTWEETLLYARQRNCDIITLATATSDRRRNFYFSEPYLTSALVIATRSKESYLANLSAATGKTIGVEAGYAFTESLKSSYPEITFVLVESLEHGLKMVKRGEIFGFIDILPPIAYAIQQNFSGELKIAGRADEKLELGMAIRNDEPILLQIMNKALSTLDQADHQRIINRWISVTYEEATDYRLVWRIMIGAGCIMALLLYRHYALRRYNVRLQQQNSEIRHQADLLQQTQQQLLMTQYAVDSSAFPIFWVRHDAGVGKGVIIHANSTAADSLGYSLPQLLDLSLDEIDTNLMSQEHRETYAQGRTGHALSTTSVFRRRDGSTFPVELHISSFEYGGTPYHFIFFNDISKQQEMEEKLHRSMKMETVGMMAGGVAHDLNNILSGIVSYPELILLKLPRESEFYKQIEAIHRSGKQAAQIVADLLTVARGAAAVRETINVNNLITEYTSSPEFKSLQRAYPRTSCTLNLDPELENSTCSQLHIKKSIMNLVTNSFEASGESGSVVISTANMSLTAEDAANLHLEPGNYVLITVKDDGIGIPSDALAHIFEPFYTKKMMGKSGTGLGLTIVWNTAQDHSGNVLVDNVGDGTRFRFYLPATDSTVSRQPVQEVTTELQGNGEKILVIDDEPQQLDIARLILETLNYQPVIAESGEKGLVLVQKERYSLILLDMIMAPGMNGRETYEKILEIAPAQKAIIVSGFAEDHEVRKVMEMGAGAFIRKPYSLHHLAMTIRDILDKPRG